MELWIPQQKAVAASEEAIKNRMRRCIYAPTGGGKTHIFANVCKAAGERGEKTIIFVNRVLLIEQTAQALRDIGLRVGIRAANFEDQYDPDAPHQISSADSERARALDKNTWPMHPADVMIIDEAHIQNTNTIHRLMKHYEGTGAAILGFTATPIGLSGTYDDLFISGTIADYRACGALVPAIVKSIEQPDTRKVKRNATGEYVLDGEKRRVYTQSIVGNVIDRYKKYNPDCRPTMLTAPGVQESVWFTEKFNEQGINWAHIDATDAIIHGKRSKLTRTVWEDLSGQFQDGAVKGISFRFKCLDMETEVMTESGWVSADKMTYDHKVASVDIKTGDVSYDKPRNIIRKIHKGDMYNIAGCRVTDDHDMVINHKGEWIKSEASDVYMKGEDFFVPFIPWYAEESLEYGRLVKWDSISVEKGCEEDVWCVETKHGTIITRRHDEPISLVGNCREGVNFPFAYHLILATPIGSVASYIQICGRVMRSAPGKDHCLIQDHGGVYWQHGSPNNQMPWETWWNMPEHAISDWKQNQIKDGKAQEPIRCPNCEAERLGGITCPQCGHTHPRSQRMVMQENGQLKEIDGGLVRPRHVKQTPDTEQNWKKMYYGYSKGKKERSFAQMYAHFCYEYGYSPPRNLPLMPATDDGWYRTVHKVSPGELLR